MPVNPTLICQGGASFCKNTISKFQIVWGKKSDCGRFKSYTVWTKGVIPIPDIETLKAAQHLDDILRETIERCTSCPEKANGCCHVRSNNLRDSVGGEDAKIENDRRVVPAKLVPDVIWSFREAPHSGREEIKKTRLKIGRKYFWHRMSILLWSTSRYVNRAWYINLQNIGGLRRHKCLKMFQPLPKNRNVHHRTNAYFFREKKAPTSFCWLFDKIFWKHP